MVANYRQKPSFAEEQGLEAQGYRLIAGVDEVGRGALMGPVVAAAVILPHDINIHWQDKVRESKQLRPAAREILFNCIYKIAISVGVGMSSPEVIDAQGIIKATRLAMQAAIDRLSPRPRYLLIDYMLLPEVPLPQKGITDGDSLCFSIACASIVAKVTRDRIMVELDGVYPGYGLAEHKGYGTKEHLAYLRQRGPCPIHRQSFKPVREIINKKQ